MRDNGSMRPHPRTPAVALLLLAAALSPSFAAPAATDAAAEKTLRTEAATEIAAFALACAGQGAKAAGLEALSEAKGLAADAKGVAEARRPSPP